MLPGKPVWRSPNGSLYLASLFFALMGVCIKLLTGSDASTHGLGWRLAGSHDMDAVPIAFYRSLFPALALLPWLWHDLFKSETRRHLPVLILRGLAGGGAMVAYFVAIDRTELSTAVLLNYTSPVWAALLAGYFLKESVPRNIYLAFPVAFSGVYFLTGGAGDAPEPGRMVGYLAGLGSAVLAGIAYTSVRQLSSHVSALMVVFWFSLVSCVMLLPWLPAHPLPSPGEWVLLLLAGIFAGVAQWTMTIGYQLNKAARASTMNIATVAITSLLAITLLGERFTPRDGVGMLLILLGLVIASRR
ncbi:MAG: hypothetical protein AMXMBFR33_08420 [Candidatus Xenobia bacterium]